MSLTVLKKMDLRITNVVIPEEQEQGTPATMQIRGGAYADAEVWRATLTKVSARNIAPESCWKAGDEQQRSPAAASEGD
jgi:hypothetical protein